MNLFLTALDQQANPRDFSCEIPLLEVGFDFLNILVAKGNTLLSAYVVDENHRTDLPLAAFNGLPFSAIIKTLQREWQAVLNQPVSITSAHKQKLIGLTRRRIDPYQDLIVVHQRMILHCQKWLNQSPRGNKPSREAFTTRYAQMLLSNQQQLAKAQFGSGLVRSRLNQLVGYSA